MHYIAFDSHKRYTLASVEAEAGGIVREAKIVHERGALRRFLSLCDAGSPVALEAVGNWYWIVDEIEAAGMVPRLVNARRAKLRMGSINKTDKLDARGLNLLQRNQTLPTVWIPPGDLRDFRDLPRTRMVLVGQRTQIKNRIQAALGRYALGVADVDDTFGKRARPLLLQQIGQLPPQTHFGAVRLLEELDGVQHQIEALERQMREVFRETREVQLLRSLPGVADILSVVIALEVGDVARFPDASRLATYAGTTPRIHSSGGKTWFGPTRPDINRYLKWAFVEAANVVAIHRRHWPWRHVARLYERVRSRKGHPKAVGAVARHLAEATYWILKKGEPYREPASQAVPPTEGQARAGHGA